MAQSFSEIIQSDKPVLVDFSAEWCGPCQMLGPILSELKTRVKDKAAIVKVDVDRNQQLARSLRIQSVPTLVIYQKGEIKWRQSGVKQAAELEYILNQFMLAEV
ncbi:MAG: thioredoxin [Flammeovirgaceae bacterium]|nr:thioredoxin [Flammeovirgaceae bacterium]MBR08300.1 thioredoxin [Rickettsiales bacterium]|tara:strand:+ start:4891 stop:5202 length:312 start_codon:yes stop_codon:yes gene_type:complete